jgi:hypothetical protein
VLAALVVTPFLLFCVFYVVSDILGQERGAPSIDAPEHGAPEHAAPEQVAKDKLAQEQEQMQETMSNVSLVEKKVSSFISDVA